MNAVVLRRFGGPEVLRLETLPLPVVAEDEVLVRVCAVSVNRVLDLAVRSGTYEKAVSLPHVLGADPAGIVESVGANVSKVSPGDRVAVVSRVPCGTCRQCQAANEGDCPRGYNIGVHRWGGYADYVAVPARSVHLVPAGLPFPEASVVSRHASAAHQMLATRAKLRPSERLLITGAAGALGSMAIQVAKLLGATVIAAAGADERVAFARTLGADVGINYRATDLPAEIARLVGEVDAVLETTGDPTVWSGALASIAQGGRLVSCAAHGGGTVPLDVKRLYSRRLTVLGSAGSNATDVSWALAKAEAGELRPHIARTLPLRQAADAHRLVESNQVLGKVILQPADD